MGFRPLLAQCSTKPGNYGYRACLTVSGCHRTYSGSVELIELSLAKKDLFVLIWVSQDTFSPYSPPCFFIALAWLEVCHLPILSWREGISYKRDKCG